LTVVIITKSLQQSKMELFWSELWLSYFDEEKPIDEQTETTRSLSDLRCRKRRAL